MAASQTLSHATGSMNKKERFDGSRYCLSKAQLSIPQHVLTRSNKFPIQDQPGRKQAWLQ